MIITDIQAQRRSTERVNIHVDGTFRLAIGAEIAYAAGLHVGDSITEAQLTRLEAEDLHWKARESALNLLSFRARSATEVRRRLRQKDFPDEVIERCVAELESKNLLDDASFAESFIRDRVRLKPRGARRLKQELREKGVDAEAAEAAVGEVLENSGLSEVDLARKAAERWKPRAGEDLRKARNRLYGYLGRRGFNGDAIRIVMAEVLSGDDEAS